MDSTTNSLKRRHQNACVVCEDESDGQSLHFGQSTCRACAAFFRRSVSQNLQYNCQRNGDCEIDKGARNACRACRLQKCLAQGMQPSAVQNSRDGPSNLQQQFYNMDNNGPNEQQQQQQHYQQQESPSSTCPDLPQQYKHLSRIGQGMHQFLSLLKAVQATAQEDFSLIAGILAGEHRPLSRFDSSKRSCKIAASLMYDVVERFYYPFNELPLEDKPKIYTTFKTFFCNLVRAYTTSKEYGPDDDRLLMPDGGYVQLSQLHLFFKDSKMIAGDPEQVARIFHDAIQYLLINVVGHMRKIDMQEMELAAMVGLFLWTDSPEVSAITLQLAQHVRNEIIFDMHHYYRSLGLVPEEITLKTANLFLIIPKMETAVKMMIEDASISDLFSLVAVEESCNGSVV